MSGWSFLFRALLCLALVLNGVGTVHAAAGMQLGQHGVGEHASPAPGDDACHGRDADSHRETPSGSTPDCCEGGACACTCASFAHAMPPQPAVTTAAWNHSAIPAALSPGHASAALQRSIRPPIG